MPGGAAPYDITRPLRAGMPVWPGDAPCRLSWTARTADGAGYNASELALSVHTGTHADGPYHLLPDGARIGEVPLEVFTGTARVVDARGRQALDSAWVAEVLAGGPPTRLLAR